MKKGLLLIAAIITAFTGFSQMVEDSVSLQAGYANQSYYNLENGEVSNVDNTKWDIAFEMATFGWGIKLNSASGAKLYLYPKGDTSAWNTIDTAGMDTTWSALYDSDTSWSTTAFTPFEIGFDIGWGTYNPATHHITGDSIYVIQLVNGDYKKLIIEDLINGVYRFRYADLSGTNEKNMSLKKSDFGSVNFAYYSISGDSSFNREPDNTTWDFVFTKYTLDFGFHVTSGTGALHNNGTEVAKMYPIADPETNTDFATANYTHHINGIGYDWKTLNFQTFKYEMEDSLCYFVKNVHGDIYRLVFTEFGGSSNGNIKFKKEKLSGNPSSIEEEQVSNSLVIYPNPAQGNVNLLVDASSNTTIQIVSMTGAVVYSNDIEAGFQSHNVNLDEFKSGMYVVNMISDTETITKKMIIK